MDALAGKIMVAIKKYNPEMTETQLRIAKYGIQCILSDVLKLVLFLLLFLFLGLLQYYIAAAVVYISMRAFSGGYHADTWWGCFFTSLACFAVIVAAGIYVPIPPALRACMILLTGYINFIFAPVDHPNKPLRNLKRKVRFKYLSVALAILWGAVSFFLNDNISVTIVISALVTALLLPAGKIKNRKKIALESRSV